MRQPIRHSPASTIALAVALALAACAPKTGNDSGSGSGDIVIGTSIPVSGELAGFGGFVKWGYQHAVNEVNAAGGITVGGKKRKVRLDILDDKTNPNTTASNVQALISAHKVDALLGSCTPFLVNAGAVVADRQRVPMVTGCDPTVAFTSVKKWSWVWDIFFYEPNLAEAPFQTLAAHGAATNKKVAILHDNGPDGQVVGGHLWPAMAKKYGYRVVKNVSFPTDNSDFSSAVQDAKRADADIVLVDSGTPQAVSVRKQMATAGYTPKVLVMEKGAEPTQFATALGDLANGALVGGYWDPSFPYPGARALAQAYAKETGQGVSQHIADSYTAARVLLDAIKAAGSTDKQKVNDAIAKTDATYPVGPVRFDAQHAAKLNMAEMQWQNGKTVVVWPKDRQTGSFLAPIPSS
jgi:branched-chain amino acid transport system substrate-binding protein